jgi:hypothetical protein|tara:strand:+ start:513 stop:947 length:435 start_codon:yes stop_codon:yes gene_type:complete
MKNIDFDNIFNLFGEEDVSNNTTNYADLTSTPIYWLGMHKKLILNHINFRKKAIRLLKDSNMELDPAELAAAGEVIAYNRAWFYIKKIDLSNKDHVEAILAHGDDFLETSLELAIKHFQSPEREEYEKCLHLLEVLKLSKELRL